MQNVPSVINKDLGLMISVGSTNETLLVTPLINSGFSVLKDSKCTNCISARYNSSGEWVVNGTNNVTEIYSQYIGKIKGKSVIDSFCNFIQNDACYSNKTEDHYEFFSMT